jgi:hypothetical protein
MINSIELGSVTTFKLNSGEEMIAKVVESNWPLITVSSPVSIAPSQQGVGLVPSMYTADPKLDAVINMNSVSLYAVTEDAVRMKYIEATTGIKVPEKKKLILG